jgi:single-strand DNA-binding protein
MNSCIMMVQITEAAQLRYIQDNQLAIAEMKVQFPALRPEEPTAEVKAIGWGNTAQEIVKYQVGDQVIVEGRWGMNRIQLEGYKETRAELTISKIYEMGSMGEMTAAPAGMSAAGGAPVAATAQTMSKAKKAPAPAEAADFDEIPF